MKAPKLSGAGKGQDKHFWAWIPHAGLGSADFKIWTILGSRGGFPQPQALRVLDVV